MSLTLQRNNITIPDALTAIDTAKMYFKGILSEEYTSMKKQLNIPKASILLHQSCQDKEGDL